MMGMLYSPVTDDKAWDFQELYPQYFSKRKGAENNPLIWRLYNLPINRPLSDELRASMSPPEGM
jgi:hypothetical protein